MKKIVLSAAVLVSLIATQEAQAQQGFGTNLPDKSSVIELKSSKKGLLIPRVDIEDLSTPAPVVNPATSLLVYNTNKVSGEGFYYWDSTKWVRFTTASVDLTAKVVGKDEKVEVTPAVNGNITTYTVGVDETKLNINNLKGKLDAKKIVPGTEGQVLVTKNGASGLEPTWVPASDITAAITAANGLTKNGSAIELGGTLTKPTVITTNTANTLAIKGLQGALKTANDEVVVMGADGILKKISKTDLVESAIDKGLQAKTLKGEGITVTAGSTVGATTQVINALLADVTLGIADNAITSAKIANGTIQPEDMKKGANNTVLVTDASGNVKWIDKLDFAPSTGNLTGENNVITVSGGNNAVLGNVSLSIANGGITSGKIANNAVTEGKIANDAVTPEKIKGEAANNGKVITTEGGKVKWVAPETLVGKTVVAPGNYISVSESELDNVKTYTVSANLANGTTPGVVKQASTDAEVLIGNTGELSLDRSKIVVGGDLSGNVGSAAVVKIQGTPVDDQTPGNNQVLTYDEATKKWTPKNLPAAQDVNQAIKVKNGLSKDAGAGKEVILGGALDRETKITTSSTYTLAIEGLQDVTTSNKMVVAEDNGKLRTLERTLVYDVTADQTVQSLAGYSAFVPQIDIYATISTANINITLPTASDANKGQIITVKVANTTEPVGEHYVNISSVGGNTVSGQLPYQSWTVKSNGTKWYLIK